MTSKNRFKCLLLLTFQTQPNLTGIWSIWSLSPNLAEATDKCSYVQVVENSIQGVLLGCKVIQGVVSGVKIWECSLRHHILFLVTFLMLFIPSCPVLHQLDKVTITFHLSWDDLPLIWSLKFRVYFTGMDLNPRLSGYFSVSLYISEFQTTTFENNPNRNQARQHRW